MVIVFVILPWESDQWFEADRDIQVGWDLLFSPGALRWSTSIFAYCGESDVIFDHFVPLEHKWSVNTELAFEL